MRRFAGLVAAVQLLALVAVASAAATPRAIHDGEPGAKALARRPREIVYSGDGSAFLAGRGSSASSPGHLHWTLWGRTEARGWGGDWHDNCKPDCASGTYTAYQANVHLYRPRWLGGRYIFTRMTVTYPSDRPPYPAYQSGVWRVRAYYDYTYNDYYWH